MAARGRFGRQQNHAASGSRISTPLGESQRLSNSQYGRNYNQYDHRGNNGSPRPPSIHVGGTQNMQGPRTGSPAGGYQNRGHNRGPRPSEDVCIGEEVKIAVNLAIERFRRDDNAKDLEFPSSLTATERAYVHRMCEPLGLKSKSKGKGATRYLTISKKQGTQTVQASATFQLVRNSRHQIHTLLQRFPLTSKERQELQPRAEKTQFSRELNKTTTGRLNNGVPQVPPRRGESDLSTFRESLPVNAYREDILNAITHNPVCLVSGETGSGKTTQVPQLILDDCYAKGWPCRIFCTQPRRIAALSVAERVSAERGEKIGQTVGYQIRLESKVSPKTLLTFCTNGVLLRTLMGGDNALHTVTHVIVDEVHERDRFSDFLLIALRDLMMKYTNLKVILMSATLNTDLFVKYFNNCPLISIPGSLFNVQEYYLEDILKWTGYTNKKMQHYMADLAKVEKQQQHLNEWCNTGCVPTAEGQKATHGHHFEMEAIVSPGELGEEKEELEPWLIRDMDQLMCEVWLNGDEDAFCQIFHLITSEGVSVDYVHSETSATPLMIASARGFTVIIEQLLNMGANINTKASNGWAALDWAKKFKQTEVVELLHAYIAASEEGQLESVESEEENFQPDISSKLTQQDRDLLAVYQNSFDDDKVDIEMATSLVHKIHTTQPEGAILIFLPGYDDIVTLRDRINDDKRFEHTKYILFTLHSAMQSSDQRRVFRPTPPGVRKIILATNIAETSITINDVVYVINSGKVKEKTFDALTSVVMLKSNWISKASAKQRMGRAGRCRPGVCYSMFSSIRYDHMQDYQLPEILRYPLQELCLHTKLLTRVSVPVAEFLSKAPEAPPFLVIRHAVQLLKQMDAFDQCEDLTELGHHLTDLPLEPQLGKMVLYSVVLKCLDPVLTIVCALAYKDPFMLPSQPYQKRAAATTRKRFAAGTYSDHMAYLRAFQAWQKSRSDGWERSFCEKNFLSSASLEMIVGMRTQLLGQLRASGFVRARGGGDIRDLNTNSENWAVVKAALCAGMYPKFLRVDRDRKVLVSQKENKVRIHSTSVLSPASTDTPYGGGSTLVQVLKNLPADWLIYEEMSRADKLAFVRCCSVVTPITVAIFAGPAKLSTDTIREAEHGPHNGNVEFPDNDSDSESEDREDLKRSTLKLDDWISFKVDPEGTNLALNLRQKWHSLFFRRMRTPSKPWSQIDEAVLRAVINVLTNEEQASGLQQPAGIGQRPRPMSAESFNGGGGRGSYDYEDYSGYYDNRPGNRVMRKTPATPPRKSPKYFNRGLLDEKSSEMSSVKSGSSPSASANNSASNSLKGSASSTPCPSPQPSSPSRWGDKDPSLSSPHPCRYFIMKCNNQKNLDISLSKAVWATSAANEKKINKSYKDGKIVHLIFSVQGSGHFQGFGKMVSTIGREKSHDFSAPGLSGNFEIDWVKRANIPFQSTHHLLNPWNENKKVQVSRDGQEIEPNVGEALVKLWERYPKYQPKSGHLQAKQQGQGDGPIQEIDTDLGSSEVNYSLDQSVECQSGVVAPGSYAGRESSAGTIPSNQQGSYPGYGFQGQAQSQSFQGGHHQSPAGQYPHQTDHMSISHNSHMSSPTSTTQMFGGGMFSGGQDVSWGNPPHHMGSSSSNFSPRFVTPVMSQATAGMTPSSSSVGRGGSPVIILQRGQTSPEQGSPDSQYRYNHSSPGAYQHTQQHGRRQ